MVYLLNDFTRDKEYFDEQEKRFKQETAQTVLF